MTRKEKEVQTAWLRDQFRQARALFLTDFSGLTVAEMNSLRSQLREQEVKFKVVKNTLARRAYVDTDVAAVGEDLVGPRAAAWTPDEDKAPAVAKILVDFAKTNPNLELISGVLSGQRVLGSELEALSQMPGKDELRAKLLGTMIAPLSSFVGTLAAVPRSLVTVLKAIEDKKAETAEPSAG